MSHCSTVFYRMPFAGFVARSLCDGRFMRILRPLQQRLPSGNPAIPHSSGPVGFPSSGYPDFGFILKADAGFPASSLVQL
jgi:hypothetical protein